MAALAACAVGSGCAPPGPTAYPVPIATATACAPEQRALRHAGAALDAPVGVFGTLGGVLTGDRPMAGVGHLADGTFTLVPSPGAAASADLGTLAAASQALYRCRTGEIEALVAGLRARTIDADTGLARVRGLRNARDRDRAALETVLQALEARGGDVGRLRAGIAAADVSVSASIDAVEQSLIRTSTTGTEWL